MVTAILSLVLAGEPAWAKDSEVDGISIELREVAGSPFPELRLVHVTKKATLAQLCDEAWGDGRYDPTEPDLKARRVLEEDAGVRLTWEEIAPAVVSPRDYLLRQTVERSANRCVVRYQATTDPRAPAKAGFVRISKLWGSWAFEAEEGGVKVTYLSFSDPGGSIPAFLVRGPQRSAAVTWMKRTVENASRRK